MEEVKSEIIDEIDDALSKYNQSMNFVLNVLQNEHQFRLKHEEAKANEINNFKQKFSSKDIDYIDLHISNLEKAIAESCNKLYDRFLNQMKKSGNFYERFINESIVSYTQLMNDLLNNTSLSEEKLDNLHQNVVKDVLIDFDNNFRHEGGFAVIESNKRKLEMKIRNEFLSIKRKIKINNNSNERLLDLMDKSGNFNGKSVNEIISDLCSEIGNSIYNEKFNELNFIDIGNFGIVCKAEEKKYNRIFAIKKIPLYKESEEKAMKEIHILSQLKNDFIVSHKSFWIEDNYLKKDHFKKANKAMKNSDNKVFIENKTLLLHIQMEFCLMTLKEAMGKLNQKLNQKISEVMTPFGYSIASELFIEILSGVDYLHKQNVIHRDLKPNNILISDGKNGNFIKIADFGIATIHEFKAQPHTKYKGTIRYAAPEVMRSEYYDTKADIYSLGVIVQELFNIDINTPIKEKELEKELENKYSSICNIAKRMLSAMAKERPDSETILKERTSWALNLNALEDENIIKYKIKKYTQDFKSFHLNSLLFTDEKPKDTESLRRMDIKATQILSIGKQQNKSSKYVLNLENLNKLLDPIKDKEVAVISIAGVSCQGKSFLLNYMIRYLSYTMDVNWIGRNDGPLEGFGWNTDLDPQTSGIWLSKPFIVRQLNGKEIAVLLMDTQGVFKEFSTQRDWSTIVGISLLSSSCFIFNVFNNLGEDILMVLESFLRYGLLAAQSNGGSEADTPFQSLMFLIRDWNNPSQWKYGQTGGKQFLDRKLEIKEDQSSSSQTARHLIKKCFKEVSCFLMPDPGDKAKDLDFNGNVAHLSSRFVDKMKEFITFLLNPEELKTKMINNCNLTAGDLCEYLKAYIQIFNSEELPKPIDIVEASAKTADLIQINKLKDLYMNELRSYLQTKPFIERKSLKIHSNECRNEKITSFNGLKKTNDKEIEKELYELLNQNLVAIYEQIYNENEQRREYVLIEAVSAASASYLDIIFEEIGSKFVDTLILDEFLRHQKKHIIDIFSENYGEEDKSLFATHYLNLTKFIENSESAYKSKNYRRIAEAEKNNMKAVIDSIESYRSKMRSILNKNVFLTKEQFNRNEEEIKVDIRELFRDNCTFGDSKFIKKFELEFEQKLTQSKSELKSLNRTKIDNTILNTDAEVNKSFADYREKMKGFLQNIGTDEQLNEKHEQIKSVVFQQLQDNCLYKDHIFLKPFLEKLEKEIYKELIELKTKLSEQIEKVKNSYKNSITESKTVYIKDMELLFRGEEFYSEKELNNFHEKIKNNAILNFKNQQIQDINNEVDKYLNQLEVLISGEFDKFKQNNKLKRDFKEQNLEVMTNYFSNKYEDKMEELISVEGESELMEKHEELREEIIKEFTELNPFPDSSSFDPYLEKLEDMIKKSVKDFLQLFELEFKFQESTAKILISNARKFYREEMNKYYQKTSFHLNQKLQQFNDSVVNRALSKFESEKGKMSSEKYKNLIIESLKDIYLEIKEENDMNTPTIPAIGIDLGTTNSCVAYFKPDRRGGNTIVIPNELGKNTTASVVAFSDTFGEVVGDVAKDEAYGNPHNTLFLAKRLIGRRFDETSVQNDMKLWSHKVVDDGNDIPKFSVKIKGSEETFYPEQISAKILKKMKEIAETHLRCKVTKAVITVPAYFNDSQKQATKDAGAIAGLEVMKIINEPTAAAIAFKLNRNDDKVMRKVLIYDFGGGTFDVAVLVIDRGTIDIKAVGGDNHLGGVDFDVNIVNYCLEQFSWETGLTVDKSTNEGEKALIRLKNRCEVQKCNLSSAESTIISIDNFFVGEDLRVVLTRDEFERLNNDLFIKSMDLVQQTLSDANMNNLDIDDVVLVGGSTRIPRIQVMISDLFGGKPLNHAINPDEAVAVGAAIQAAILNGVEAQELKQLKVSDVSPMTLGIKVKGGFMSVIIPRNSKVPNSFMKHYVTVYDYQTSVDIEIYEGEDKMADQNRLLGKFGLSGIPSASKGEEPISVTFNINDEGILHVNAKIVSNGVEEEIAIKEHKGRLTDQQLEKLIEQAEKNMKIEKHFTEKIVDKLLSDNNSNSNDNYSHKKFDFLRSIEKSMEKLETGIKSLETNGEENRFLIFEAKGLKLLEQLDKMGDLSDHKFEELRDERRKAIQRLKNLSESLKQSSIENLKQLLSNLNNYLKPINEDKSYEDLFNRINTFIDENKSPSVKQIDDYRYQLEGIKHKIFYDECNV